MKNKNLLWVIFGVIVLFSLSACNNSFVKTEQPNQVNYLILQDGNRIGQTFVSRYAGLNGVILYLSPDSPGDAKITFRLKTSPDALDVLRTATITLEEISSPGEYLFAFDPLIDSNLENYFFSLSLQGSGSIQSGYSYANSYLNGSAYLNNQPYEGQLLFKLSFVSSQALKSLTSQFLEWGYWLLLSLSIITLPGFAILSYGYPKWSHLDWVTKFVFSAGISLCIYPLLMLWTNLIGINLGRLYFWIPIIISIFGIIFRYRSSLKAIKIQAPVWKDIDPFNIAVLFVILLISATRIWAARSLSAPLWGDSYQHSLITQLILDNQGLFKSWLPYAELETFTYHFGFHSFASVFNWIAALPVEIGILWIGQFTNILACVALYPLAIRISKNRWGGLLAIFLSGLVFSMPMFYVNWGRYTQLTGQVILIIFILLAWDLLEPKSQPRKLLILTWISLAGLVLTHYRISIFALMFLLAYLFIYPGWKRWRELLLKMIAIGLGSFLLILPWFINIFSGKLDSILKFQISSNLNNLSQAAQQTNSIGDLLVYLPGWAWIILPIVIGWGLWKRDRDIVLFSLWWYFIIVSANPGWLYLPGTGIMTNFAVFIAAYIPASVIISTGIYWLISEIGRQVDRLSVNKLFQGLQRRNLIWIPLLFLLLTTGLVSAKKRLSDVYPNQFGLLTQPDLRAMEWIKENLAQESGFLVNSTFAYSDSLIAGTDGGWWLPLITQRQSSLPPLNYGAERGPRPDYRQWINQLSIDIQSKGIDHSDVIKEMSQRGITHVYIGQQQGLVNSTTPLIRLDQLLASPHFQPVYHQDRVWIFKLVQELR